MGPPMTYPVTFVLFLWIASFTSHAYATSHEAWEEIAQYEDVIVYRQKRDSSELFAYRGVGIVPIPIGKVIAVIRDARRKPEWVDRVNQAQIVQEDSPFRRIEYLKTDLPWPIQDRDFLYESRVDLNRNEHRVTFHIHSILHSSIPEYPDSIRAQIFQSTLTLTALEGGQKTHIVAETHTDPGGSLPNWIINWVQKRWPARTLRGLSLQASKPDIVDHPWGELLSK